MSTNGRASSMGDSTSSCLAVTCLYTPMHVGWAIDLLELQVQAQLRASVDPQLFLSSYADVSASFAQGGTAKYVQGINNAALFTLPGNGIASGVVTLDSCALWAPHYHPRSLSPPSSFPLLLFHPSSFPPSSTSICSLLIMSLGAKEKPKESIRLAEADLELFTSCNVPG